MDLFGSSEPALIPAYSLWQPWASLVFETDPAFRKGYETRDYAYPAKYHGERLAIQAAAISPTSRIVAEKITEELDEICIQAFGARWRLTLPRGAYLGTVVLERCSPSAALVERLGYADRITGIWGDGRFGWKLGAPQRLAEPVAVKGKQGWWKAPASLFPAPAKVDRSGGAAETAKLARPEGRERGAAEERHSPEDFCGWIHDPEIDPTPHTRGAAASDLTSLHDATNSPKEQHDHA